MEENLIIVDCFFTANNTLGQCGNRIHNNYSDNALGVFVRVSNIYRYTPTILNISSPAQEIKLCEDSKPVNDEYIDNVEVRNALYVVRVYPGEQFHVPVVAMGQAISSVPAKLLPFTTMGKITVNPMHTL